MEDVEMDTLTYYEQITIQQADRQFLLDLIIGILTLVSVGLVYLDYRNRKNKERAEKSIIIAEEFAQNIIPKLALLHKFFEDKKLIKIVNKHKFLKFSDFDVEELNELYTKEEISEYQETLNKNRYILVTDYTNENKKIDFEEYNITLLNELEHMCMYISTKVADEKYIYNSLHQQFFKSISLLYIFISLINTDTKDKYYTNLIHVYNLWTKKYIKITNKEEKFKKKQKKKKQKLLPQSTI